MVPTTVKENNVMIGGVSRIQKKEKQSDFWVDAIWGRRLPVALWSVLIEYMVGDGIICFLASQKPRKEEAARANHS